MDNLFEQINKLNIASQFEYLYNLMRSLIYNGFTIKEIDERCHKLTPYKIIHYLIEYGNDDKNIITAIENYYNSLTINQDKCLIIADTHIGRRTHKETINTPVLQNEQGLFSAYNHAIRNNISNVIHLGDLVEGKSYEGQLSLDKGEQEEYLKRIYPYNENIKTYLLYGNHDYNFIYFSNAESNFYRNCKNMELIGVNYSYINFGDQRIKLSHYSQISNHFKNHDMPFNFELSGHSHTFTIHDRLVHAPNLSSLEIDKDSIGFLEMIDEGDYYVFKFFNQYGAEVREKEKVLVKSMI